VLLCFYAAAGETPGRD